MKNQMGTTGFERNIVIENDFNRQKKNKFKFKKRKTKRRKQQNGEEDGENSFIV